MTHSDRQPDGEWSRSVKILAVGVAGGKHGRHENERDDELDHEPLKTIQRKAVTDQGQSQIRLHLGRSHSVEYGSTDNGAHTLSDDIRQGPRDADPASDQHGDRYCRVDVAAADPGYHPDDCRHGQTERQGDLHNWRLVFQLPVCTARATPDEDQNEGAEEFSKTCPIEFRVFQIAYTANTHDCVTRKAGWLMLIWK